MVAQQVPEAIAQAEWSNDLPTLEATQRLAEQLASLLSPGDTVILEGDLGAGKTELVRRVLRCLGVPRSIPVTSPTFALINEYELPNQDEPLFIVHADLYRVDAEEAVVDLGLIELLSPDTMSFIEWGERFTTLLRPTLLVRLELMEKRKRRAKIRAENDRGALIVQALLPR